MKTSIGTKSENLDTVYCKLLGDNQRFGQIIKHNPMLTMLTLRSTFISINEKFKNPWLRRFWQRAQKFNGTPKEKFKAYFAGKKVKERDASGWGKLFKNETDAALRADLHGNMWEVETFLIAEGELDPLIDYPKFMTNQEDGQALRESDAYLEEEKEAQELKKSKKWNLREMVFGKKTKKKKKSSFLQRFKRRNPHDKDSSESKRLS